MNKNVFNVENWQVDPLHNSIQQGDTFYELEPKAMEALVYLAQHAGKTVSKHELEKTIWPNQEVTKAALSRIIGQLRRCLEGDQKSQNFIMTIKNTGYRLVAEVIPDKNYSKRSPFFGPFNSSNTQRFFSLSIKAIIIFFLAILVGLIYKYYQSSSIATEKAMKTRYITAEKGDEFEGALSPNGEMVAYTKTIYSKESFDDYYYALFIKNVENNEITQLTERNGTPISDQYGIPSYPAWSPDSRYIAFSYDNYATSPKNRHEILIVDIKTNQIKPLIKLASQAHSLSWSPDEQYLIFIEGLIMGQENIITQLNIKTKEKQLITNPTNSNAGIVYKYLSHAPDGQSIAVIRSDQGLFDSIDLIDLESGSSKNIALRGYQDIWSLTWKDINTLFLVVGEIGSNKIVELSIASGKSKVIPVDENHIEYISYSRATKRLIIDSIAQTHDIFYTKYADDLSTYLEWSAVTNAAWQVLEGVESSDGKYIALTISQSGSYEIGIRVGGEAEIIRLTEIKADSIKGLDWAPKSDKLAFVATVNNETAVYWVSISDKRVFKFSQGSHNYSLIGWENQVNSLLFASNAYGQWKLNDNTIESVADEPIMQGRLSPDRKTIYFIKEKFAGIWSSELPNIYPQLVPGTESIIIYWSWTVTKEGIIYALHDDISEFNKLYFKSFTKKEPVFISTITNLRLNRIYWSKNRLFYSAYTLRENNILMIEGLP